MGPPSLGLAAESSQRWGFLEATQLRFINSRWMVQSKQQGTKNARDQRRKAGATSCLATLPVTRQVPLHIPLPPAEPHVNPALATSQEAVRSKELPQGGTRVPLG